MANDKVRKAMIAELYQCFLAAPGEPNKPGSVPMGFMKGIVYFMLGPNRYGPYSSLTFEALEGMDDETLAKHYKGVVTEHNGNCLEQFCASVLAKILDMALEPDRPDHWGRLSPEGVKLREQAARRNAQGGPSR